MTRDNWQPRFVPDQPKRVHTINPATGLWPISEWGSSCGRGFVSDSRFDSSAMVIKRTNRAQTRKIRRAHAA